MTKLNEVNFFERYLKINKLKDKNNERDIFSIHDHLTQRKIYQNKSKREIPEQIFTKTFS